MNMGKDGTFFGEMEFWLFAAVAVTFFVIAFRGLFKIASAKLPFEGLKEVLAA